MDLQTANSVVDSQGNPDDLLLQYGKIMERVSAGTVYRDLVNTNYIDTPVRGGTIQVRRMKASTSQAYGTARTAGEGAILKNLKPTVKVDTDREIAEEMDAKDKKLWTDKGDLAVLQSRQADFSTSMNIELEKAYFEKLELTAQANGLVDVSGGSDLQDKLTLLIQHLEKLENEYVSGVERAFMVMTVNPVIYDALEKVRTTFNNPITGRTDENAFRRVAIRPALRQGYDAIIQVVGSLAEPVVMDDFYIAKPDLSNDHYAYISYYYGVDAVMSDLVFAADVNGGGISA